VRIHPRRLELQKRRRPWLHHQPQRCEDLLNFLFERPGMRMKRKKILLSAMIVAAAALGAACAHAEDAKSIVIETTPIPTNTTACSAT
jgi:hypothetical protein